MWGCRRSFDMTRQMPIPLSFEKKDMTAENHFTLELI